MSDLESIKNIGPKMAAHFNTAGIYSAEDVHKLGLDECYTRLINAGMRPHLMAFLALDAGLKNLSFNFHNEEEKAQMRLRHDELVSKSKKRPASEIEAFLNKVGIRD